MKIAFVYSAFENIGIEILSSVLKKAGHTTELFFDPELFDDILFKNKYLGKLFSYKKKVMRQIIDANPDLILFSVVSAEYRWACEYARKLKEKTKAKIIFGGIHVTSVPDVVIKNDFVDFIVVGEGEFPILELANCIESGEIDYSIKNVWFKKDGQVIRNTVRPLIKDLDRLPYPDKDMYRKHGPPFLTGYTMQSVRGCPNRCTYCNHDIYKNYYSSDPSIYIRKRSVKNMVAELEDSHKKFKYSYIRFFDDDFLRYKDRLKEFSKLYVKKVNVPYTCIAHPLSVREDVIPYLKMSKCKQVNVGLQNINEEIRVNILNRREKNEDAIRSISVLKKANIRVIIDCMMGIPTSDENNMEETFNFFYKNTPTRLFMPWLQYFPRTKMSKIAFEQGIINEDKLDQMEHDPYNKSIITIDKSVHNVKILKYQLLFVALLVSKRLAWLLHKTKLFKIIPSESALFFNLIAYVKAWNRYEHEQMRNPKRYFSFMLRRAGIDFY